MILYSCYNDMRCYNSEQMFPLQQKYCFLSGLESIQRLTSRLIDQYCMFQTCSKYKIAQNWKWTILLLTIYHIIWKKHLETGIKSTIYLSASFEMEDIYRVNFAIIISKFAVLQRNSRYSVCIHVLSFYQQPFINYHNS